MRVVMQLYNFIDDWCKYFGSPEALENLLVDLITKCERGGAQIIQLLLDCAFVNQTECTDETVQETICLNAKELLELVLQEVSHSLKVPRKKDFEVLNLLKSFEADLADVHGMLLSCEKLHYETAARIIIFIGHVNPSKLIDSAAYLFQNAETDEHLVLLVRILTDSLIDHSSPTYSEKGGHFSWVLERILSKDCSQPRIGSNHNCTVSMQTWRNLLTLLKWETSGKTTVLNCKFVSRAINFNLLALTRYYAKERSMKVTHVLSEILFLMLLDRKTDFNPDADVVLNLTVGTVNYFFKSCRETGATARANAFKRTRYLLQRLCIHSKSAKSLALKELLERSLFSKDNVLFGAHDQNHHVTGHHDKLLLRQNKKIVSLVYRLFKLKSSVKFNFHKESRTLEFKDELLIEIRNLNKKHFLQSKTIPLTKHSSVYNGGIIGTGKRKPASINKLPSTTVTSNIQELILALRSCCALPPDIDNKFQSVSLESVTQVSLQLVQFVSPDVMYNGLPWPEEEFSKVTIERDLYIRRLFTTTPLLWDLLSFVAVNRPALCYCSVLMRALTATLMHQWNSMGDQSKSSETESYKSLMDTTIKVIDVMALGQLLPPPLSSIRDVIPYLDSSEVSFHFEIIFLRLLLNFQYSM